MKGYVQLRRGILDHLSIFTMAETKVYIALLCLVDHKTGQANLSMDKLAEATGYSRRHVQDAVKRLEALKYIKVKRSNNRWQDSHFAVTKFDNSSKKPTSTVTSDIGSDVTSDIGSDVQAPDQGKQAPENYGELKRIEEKKKYIFLSQDKTLATKLFSLILKNDPKAKKPVIDSWANEIRKLNQLDNRSHAEIERIIDWCQADVFWSTNILSAAKLRKQFTQLTIKANNPPAIKYDDSFMAKMRAKEQQDG